MRYCPSCIGEINICVWTLTPHIATLHELRKWFIIRFKCFMRHILMQCEHELYTLQTYEITGTKEIISFCLFHRVLRETAWTKSKIQKSEGNHRMSSDQNCLIRNLAPIRFPALQTLKCVLLEKKEWSSLPLTHWYMTHAGHEIKRSRSQKSSTSGDPASLLQPGNGTRTQLWSGSSSWTYTNIHEVYTQNTWK